MATLAPFRGLLYSPSHVTDLSRVIAPPYDVLTPEAADGYRARDPHNIVHLDLPRTEAGAASDAYVLAAAEFARWQQEGVLARDPAPAIYVTSQRYAARGMPEKTRWGFIALLRIEEDSDRVVLPHERTMDAPRTDRLELGHATRAQLSPIFVVYSDPDGAIASSIEGAVHRPADRWVSDEGGVDTRLWRVTDRDVVRAACEGLSRHRIWIADGHHRYAAARLLRDRLRAEESRPPAEPRSYDYVMAYFSDVEAPGLAILPYHRVLRGTSEEFDLRGLARRLERDFELKTFPFEGMDHRAEQIRRRLHEVSGRGRIAIACYTGGAEFSLFVLRESTAEDGPPGFLSGTPEPLRGLDVTLLHRGLLEAGLGLSQEQQRSGGLLRYTAEVEKALDWVDAGEGLAAFLLSAPDRHAMMRVAEAGLQMPQKSTYFFPKVLTGLVLHPFDPVTEVHSAAGAPAVPAG